MPDYSWIANGRTVRPAHTILRLPANSAPRHIPFHSTGQDCTWHRRCRLRHCGDTSKAPFLRSVPRLRRARSSMPDYAWIANRHTVRPAHTILWLPANSDPRHIPFYSTSPDCSC